MPSNLQQLLTNVKGQFGGGGSVETETGQPPEQTSPKLPETAAEVLGKSLSAETINPTPVEETAKQEYQVKLEQNLQAGEQEKQQQELEEARRLIKEAAMMAASPDSGVSAASKKDVERYHQSLNLPGIKKSDIKKTDFFAVSQYISESRKQAKQAASLDSGTQRGRPTGVIHSELGDEKGQTFNQN
jgi:hypothetical protein